MFVVVFVQIHRKKTSKSSWKSDSIGHFALKSWYYVTVWKNLNRILLYTLNKFKLFFLVKTWQPCTENSKRLLLWTRQIRLEYFSRLLTFPLQLTEGSLLIHCTSFSRYSKFRFLTKAMDFSTDSRANWALGAFYKTPATKVDFSIVLKINYSFQTYFILITIDIRHPPRRVQGPNQSPCTLRCCEVVLLSRSKANGGHVIDNQPHIAPRSNKGYSHTSSHLLNLHGPF